MPSRFLHPERLEDVRPCIIRERLAGSSLGEVAQEPEADVGIVVLLSGFPRMEVILRLIVFAARLEVRIDPRFQRQFRIAADIAGAVGGAIGYARTVRKQ